MTVNSATHALLRPFQCGCELFVTSEVMRASGSNENNGIQGMHAEPFLLYA
ncbi:Uncharacterised protein [Corynebacterium pilosum]|uniref:Uncharacterized protein n=1 Tax=Corynebacterium pilosum TaxID=35756 RepID=A0A376CL57_9CORY|nr:Uncharacterised protein [Corynebacterium pilosum]